MKYALAVIVFFGLSGCVYQTANQADIRDASILCGSSKDVDEITVNFLGGESVQCSDGRYFHQISDAIRRLK